MPRILATHLLVERDYKSFRTACGIEGIPLTLSLRFYENDTRSEGRIPGSAGNGVVAETGETFAYPRPGVRFCGRCMNKMFAKGVMGMLTPATLEKARWLQSEADGEK